MPFWSFRFCSMESVENAALRLRISGDCSRMHQAHKLREHVSISV